MFINFKNRNYLIEIYNKKKYHHNLSYMINIILIYYINFYIK